MSHRVLCSAQVQQMKLKDSRIKLMNEVLGGIKVLKLYAWEPSFLELVRGIRRGELRLLRKGTYLQAISTFVCICTPFLVRMSTGAGLLPPAEPAWVSGSPVWLGPCRLHLDTHSCSAQVSLLTLGVFVCVNKDNILDARKAFVSVSLFNVLRSPLNLLSQLISNLIQVTPGRVGGFPGVRAGC